MALSKRHRAWSFSDCPNLSECLGSSNVLSETPSNINGSFRRVKTLSCDLAVGSIEDFVREAEIHTATLPFSSEKPNNAVRLSPSFSRFSSLAYNDQCQTTHKSRIVSPSINRRVRQSPPKVVFGQPIVSSSLPTDNILRPSPLTNSLLIEYLALVTTDNPYGGLVGLSEGVSSKESARETSSSPQPRKHIHKVGVTSGPYLTPSMLSYFQEGATVDGTSNISTSLNVPSNLSSLLDSAASPPRPKVRSVSTICSPTALENIKLDEGVHLKKLSVQVEVDQLRSMLHEFERTHLLRNPSKRISVTEAPPKLSKPQKPTTCSNSQTLFHFNNIPSLTPKDPNINKQSTLEAPPTLKADTTQVSLPGSRKTSKVSIPKPTHFDTRTHTLSSLEHNIMAPVFF
nr:hypothetical transcript [Hymenolepis microstoma]